MVQIAVAGNTGFPVLEVGMGEDRGFLVYHAEDSGATRGSGDADDVREYVYMGSLSQVPADVEVPLETVRRGLHEFLRTGRRPSVVVPD